MPLRALCQPTPWRFFVFCSVPWLPNDDSCFTQYPCRFGVEDILKQLKGTLLRDGEKVALREAFNGFSSVYWRCVNRTTNKLLAFKSDEEYERGFSSVLRQDLHELVALATVLSVREHTTCLAQVLLALVFAHWTLVECKPALDAMRSDEAGSLGDCQHEMQYLRQPHAAQVLSVFRLLGVTRMTSEDYVVPGVSDDEPLASMFDWQKLDVGLEIALTNHMAEIKTGEGAFLFACLVV